MTTAIATRPATKKPVRIMFITARYFFKKGISAGNVCYAVRSIKTVKGQEVRSDYQVTIRPDGCTTCNCDSRKPCSHLLFASEIENERNAHEAEEEREVAEVLAELDATEQQPYPGQCDDCPGSAHALCCRNTLSTPEMVEQVNAELAKVQQPAATAEEVAATQSKLLLPNKVDQVAYFVQHNRRGEESYKQTQKWEASRIAQLKTTPQVRNVSRSWILNGHSGNGTFSGRAS